MPEEGTEVKVTLSRSELIEVLGALHAVSPTGGGSDTHTTYLLLKGMSGLTNEEDDQVIRTAARYQVRVLREMAVLFEEQIT